MTRWFRFYDDAVNDPKVQRLVPGLFKTWVNLLCVASKHGGRLPDAEELSFILRQSKASLTKEIDLLIDSGLIDKATTGLIPHNWSGRQYKGDVSTERVKRFRKRGETVSETSPEQRQNRTEQSAPVSGNGSVEHDHRSASFRRRVVETYAAANLPQIPDTSICDVWLAQGRNPDICVTVIASRLRGGFKPLNYFEKPIADAHAAKAPVSAKPVTDDLRERALMLLLDREARTGCWESKTPRSEVPPEIIARWKAKQPIAQEAPE